MALGTWWRKCFSARIVRRKRSNPSRFDLYLEILEDRLAPAQILQWLGTDAVSPYAPGLIAQTYTSAANIASNVIDPLGQLQPLTNSMAVAVDANVSNP